MRQHNLTNEQAALERLSLVAHDIAEELSQLGYPWPPSPPRPGAPFAPRRAMPSLAERLGTDT
jgi:hypothetical protein